MKRPRLIFVNRFYWPEEPATAQLLTDLAEGLAAKGFSTAVVTSQRDHTIPASESRNGVQIDRVPTPAWGKRNLVGRALDYAAFIRGARDFLQNALTSSDVVITMTDPPLLGPSLASVIRRRNALWVHWVQDIFPEAAAAVSRTRLPLIFKRWRDTAWRAADHCIVPGADMARFVRACGVAPERVTVSENWAPARLQPSDDAEWRRRHALENKFVVMYSGNMGRVHDFGAIPALIRALPPASGVEFVFIGDGAQRRQLEKNVKEAGLENARFLEALRRVDLAPALSSANLHLITLREGCENLVFPSKLYGIAAVGRPTLVIGPRDCEPSRIVREFGFGDGFPSNEVPAIAEFIRALRADSNRQAAWRAAALRFAAAHAGPGRALETWQGVMASLIPLAAGDEQAAQSRAP